MREVCTKQETAHIHCGRQSRVQKLLKSTETECEDPFAKVKKLIDDMITRLLKEAKEDANMKASVTKKWAKA